MKPLRILLVDDSRFFRDSAATALSTFEGVEIVAKVASAAEAFEKLKGHPADLVLMDISMPDMNGIEATFHIKALPGAPRVMLVTSHDGDAYRAAGKAAGADGYVVKERLLEAMSTVIADEKRRSEGGAEITPA